MTIWNQFGAHDVAVACCLAMAEVWVRLPLGAFLNADAKCGMRKSKRVCVFHSQRIRIFDSVQESLVFRRFWEPKIAGSNLAMLTFANSEIGGPNSEGDRICHCFVFGIPKSEFEKAHQSSLEWTLLCQGRDRRFKSGMSRFQKSILCLNLNLNLESRTV